MTKLLIFAILILTIILVVKILEKKSFLTRKQAKYRQTYRFNGNTISYQVLGQGKAIILLHGSMVANPWHDFEKKLSNFYQVYLPDLPGFGASDAINGKIHNTDLFTQALCKFIKINNLKGASVISLSLGTVVSAKAAARGCSNGKLVFIGAPSQVTGLKSKIIQLIPMSIKRILVGTYWGKDKLLIPTLNDNIGTKTQKDNSGFIRDLEITDVRAIADVNYVKEINQEFPQIVKQLKNKIYYLYGDGDAQKSHVGYLTDSIIEIKNSGHNVFADQSDKLIEEINKIINN